MRSSTKDIQWAGTRVTVMGLGRFGGGAGAVRWLMARGASVTLTDLRDEGELREPLAALGAQRPRLRLGAHDEADFKNAQVVVVNPAVGRPWENRFVRAAIDAGALVTTEIRLAIEQLPAGVVTLGITGSTGKSTTASMLHRALRATWTPGRAHLAGNIGGSLLDAAGDIEEGDALVLELSSAQLWWLSREPAWTPDIALVTNLVPNHLDWHGSIEHYTSCKRAIAGDRLCCHAGPIEEWGSPAAVRIATRKVKGMTLPGAHNAENASLAFEGALWALERTGLDAQADAERAIARFEGLEHRLCAVGTAGGVRLIDDSKCSTPQGAALAIDAFDAACVHLICGGADKGVDMSAMIDAATRCASVLCIGATGPVIAKAVRERGGASYECLDLATAVSRLADLAREGDVALLSPGCASWDQFSNYIERAHAFVREAERVLGPIRERPEQR